MFLWDLPLGTEITLRFKYKGKDACVQSQVCAVGSSQVGICAVLESGVFVPTSQLHNVLIDYKCASGVYTFSVTKVTKCTINGKFVYGVTCLTCATKLNRREEFRVFFGDLKPIKVIDGTTIEEKIMGVLKDMSPSGMGVILHKYYENDTIFEIEHSTGNFKARLHGLVCRCEELENGKGFLYGCRFREKNHILEKYLVEKQREDIQKRKYNGNFAAVR